MLAKFILAPAIVAGLLMLNPAVVAAEDDSRFITVTGKGEVSAAPDTAWITSGVRTQALSAEEALEENNRLAGQVIDTFLDADVEDKDISTSGFNVNAVYDYSQPSDGGAKSILPLGYQVTNNVTVKIRDLDGLGGILDEVIKAGGNQISGIRFGFDDREALLDEARVLAVANARKKADLYAAEAGVEAGDVAGISETGAHVPSPKLHTAASARMMEAGPAPIMSGEQQISVNITVVYFIED